ncbi:MAG: virulence RhuM family protein [Paludibacteraceae bacterium]|nr:virulence RhuM family protein [Paludibacteraceae bacterium]
MLEHIQHIYKVNELDESSTCRKFRQVRLEGKRMVNRETTMYNLDMIISVGYRVNTIRGVKFRQWANNVLKNFPVKGYAINERIPKEQIGTHRW